MAKTILIDTSKVPGSHPAIAICARYSNKPDQLIEILHDLQHELGHVPEASLLVIASALNLSRAEVYGVVTFYHDFHMKKQHAHVIKMCAAEACQAMGGRALASKAEALTAGKAITLEKTYCLGLCASSPAMLVDGKPMARIDASKLTSLIEAMA
jgi:formate dehydrogenase subunit gamma